MDSKNKTKTALWFREHGLIKAEHETKFVWNESLSIP